MAQLFHPAANTIARTSIVGVVLLVGGLAAVLYAVQVTPYMTNEKVVRDQPVPFSHEHHVKGLGLDCRYCHTSVEDSSFAGLPPTKTCMTCHSQIWSNTQMLQPVRQSWQSNQPLQWTRVHDLPDFVYFNHGIHVAKGVACATCHGQVDSMPLTWQAHSLTMSWCLDCHRGPEKYIRPREHVFNMHFDLAAYLKESGRLEKTQEELGQKLVQEYGIKTAELINCSICHR